MKPKFSSLTALNRGPLVVVASLIALTAVHADQTWTGAGTDALWTNTNNWSGTATPGAGDLAIFNATSTARLATTLGADTSILGIRIVNPSGGVSIATGNTLTIGASGIDMNVVGPPATSQNLSIAAPVVLGSAQSWNIATGRTLTVSGNISGAAFTKAGGGSVTLSGTNTFAGPILVTGGTLTFSTTSAATPGTGFEISNNATVSIGYTTGANDDTIGTLAFSGTGGTLTSTVGNNRTIITGSVTVPSGAYGIFNSGGKCNINNSGTATGAGTFRVNVGTNVVTAPDSRHYINGNWSGFTGTLELNGTTNGSTLHLKANGGNFNSDLSQATVVLSSGAGTFNAGYVGGTNGTIRIGALSGSASTNLILGTGSGASTFRIGEKNLDTTFAGTIANGVATASLDKWGTGVLTLTGTNTYTGNTAVTTGTLELGAGGSIDGAALTFGTTVAGTLFHVNGGSFKGTTTTVPASITGFRLSSGSATFSGALNAQDNSSGSLALINVQGGSLSAASVSVGRASGAVSAEPTAGATNSGFVVNGAGTIVNIAGNLSVSGSNSTANARMDAGTVTVGGTATIGLGNTSRWSVLDVKGGTFTLNNTATGVQLGNGNAGNAIFILQDGGVANVGKFTFNAAGAVAYSEIVKVNGGTLYVGAGGMVRTGTNDLCVSSLKLQGGTLGASADWVSSVNTTLTGTPIIKAADATNAPFNISLSGVLSGTGGLSKTGGGTLTLDGTSDFTGATTVSAGALLVNGTLGNTAVTVNGGTLGGTGTISGAVTVNTGAKLAPGASIESLGVSTANLNGGSLVIEYDGSAAGNIDLLAVSGLLDITNATVDFDMLGSALDDPFYIFATYGSLNGSAFANTLDLPSGYKINYAFNDGVTSSNIALVPIPEPGVVWLGALGLIMLPRRRR